MITATDLFCGAGGSSLGAEATGKVELVMAANHWQTAIDVHQTHFPDAAHDVADISQADPRRYPATDILLASPECTNHSQARGISRKRQDPTLWDAPDPTAERSRATMWDVPRFAEQLHYPAIVVENVIEATKWALWPAWWQAMELLNYRGVVLSHNSMHHGVPQSRDRIFVVWTKTGITPDLEFEVDGWCARCETWRPSRQAWKPGRTVGRYRQQWQWACLTCGDETTTVTQPAATIIDWTRPVTTVGERHRPLAPRTRQRIYAGLARHGWAPITTAGGGNTWEGTPGMRARPVTEPVPTQVTVPQTAIALNPDDALVVPMRNHTTPYTPTVSPLGTVTAGGNHHGLLMRNNTAPSGEQGHLVTPVTEPVRTVTTSGHQSLLTPAHPWAHLTVDEVIDACGFRMLEPYEVAAAMAFPTGYIPVDLPKTHQMRLAGNAVTPPVMAWIVGRIAQALETAP